MADYATVIMNFLAAKSGQVFSAAEIAKRIHVALPTVSKVLKLLLEDDLLISTRGANGGYQLGRSAREISLVDVVTAIDGMPAMTECSQAKKLCTHEGGCAVRHNWRLINQIVIAALQSVTLADMAKPLNPNALLTQIPMTKMKSQKHILEQAE